MAVNFNMEEFRKSLQEQFDYLLRNESMPIMQDSLNELVRERLHELAERELNAMGEQCEDSFSDAVKALAEVPIHLTNLDIDHRLLVKEVLKKEMKKMLKDFVDENLG